MESRENWGIEKLMNMGKFIIILTLLKIGAIYAQFTCTGGSQISNISHLFLESKFI